MDRTSRKHHKKSEDRLSALPDAVISHILCLLPTKISVSTSILARRWRFLWAHVPNLDFECENDDTQTSTPDIIYRVILRHKVKSMDTFRLSGVVCTEFQLETWISTAIERKVQKLDLCLTIMLPRCLFTCRTLVDLELHGCNGIPSNGSIYLPSLNKLRLYDVENLVGEALSHLLSGCPVLEELFICGDMNQDLGCYNISSPTIKRLTVMLSVCASEFGEYVYGVKINSPAIRYLKLHDCLLEQFSSQILNSLVEAEICCSADAEVFNFVDQLCNVKYLTISCDAPTLKDMPIRRFDNLTKLEIDTDWLLLKIFLESAHHLEYLIIRQADMDLGDWIKPKQVPKCILSHLKTVTIRRFECSKNECIIVKYLLRNAKVLKRMEIYSTYSAKKFEMLQLLSLFPRGSEACELAFY